MWSGIKQHASGFQQVVDLCVLFASEQRCKKRTREIKQPVDVKVLCYRDEPARDRCIVFVQRFDKRGFPRLKGTDVRPRAML